MPSSVLGLPSIPPPLKSIAPFLQRAEEVRSQDAVIAYWCAYYAAQVGISLKTKDTQSRNVLLELLGVLEHMKKDIGANDALDVEVAGVAYVENFALKVFAAADNEDRKGEATRATAKKFLAAANFLEVLNIFPTSDSLETNEEKIRYAKWKAADIAKALREGRRPLPGPAVPEVAMGDGPGAADILVAPNLTPPQSPGILHSIPTPSEHPSPPVFIHHIPSPTGVSDAPEPQTPPQSAHLGVWGNINTPGTWSTVATPGTARPESDADNWPSREEWMDSPTPDRFAAQEVAELSPTDRSPSTYGAERITRSSSISPRSSAVPYPVSPGIQPGEIPPESVSPRAWDMKGASTHAPPHLQFATAQPMDAPVDLTPDVIAKAQKHARFAISCLDYDDLEQARTELRTALAILGGR